MVMDGSNLILHEMLLKALLLLVIFRGVQKILGKQVLKMESKMKTYFIFLKKIIILKIFFYFKKKQFLKYIFFSYV